MACFRFALLLLWSLLTGVSAVKPSGERIVFQTAFGDIEVALYPEVAPKTCQHIVLLAKLGAYNTNHFFRVERGFVAQTQDVRYGRLIPLDLRQQVESDKTVPLEIRSDVTHDRRGVLSMARTDDPDSGTSSFSIMLGAAHHLDNQYTVFGEVTKGLEVLDKMETVETYKEGFFVMPKQRIDIMSTYVYTASVENRQLSCEQEVALLKEDLLAQSQQLERLRSHLLP